VPPPAREFRDTHDVLEQPLSGDALRGATITLVSTSTAAARLFERVAQERGCSVHHVPEAGPGVRLGHADLVAIDQPAWQAHDTLRWLAGTAGFSDIPVVVFGPPEPGDLIDQVVALHLGADIYCARDEPARLVAARCNALLRRARARTAGMPVGSGPVTIDVDRWEAYLDGRLVAGLTPTEFTLLAVLVAAGGHIVSRTELRERIWGNDFPDLELRSIDAHIYRLRRKLGDVACRLIVSAPGIGYRLATGGASAAS
jgi:DNA-binding response OmpR family regulator